MQITLPEWLSPLDSCLVVQKASFPKEVHMSTSRHLYSQMVSLKHRGKTSLKEARYRSARAKLLEESMKGLGITEVLGLERRI